MRRVALIALAAAGCSIGERQTQPPADRDTANVVDPRSLPAPEPEARHIGVIAASESVDVPSRVDGIVEKVFVGIGDRVTAGTPIAKIDERAMREQLAIAKAGARAASAQARRARAAMALARGQASRREKLGDEIVAAEEIEASRSAADQAAAVRSEALASASAERTRVARLERQLSETLIKAPFAGRISLRYAGPGESVTRGTPIVRLIAADDLRVDFVVPLADKSRYAIGDKIEIHLEGSDLVLGGVVRRIAPDLDPVAQMVTVQAELVMSDDQRARVQAGMGVVVSPAGPVKELD